MLEVEPILEAFPQDTLISYDILLLPDRTPLPLEDACLPGATRPHFYIPSTLQTLAYGSCRKVHGLSFSDEGQLQQQDSLALLFYELEKATQPLAKRPSHLFLVGDQIYADDVLPELMNCLQPLALQLMGRSIPLPEAGCVGYITDHFRQTIVKQCGLTTTSGHGHVLSFGEYAALYLVAFGNQVGFDYTFQPTSPLPQTFTSKRQDDFERQSMMYFVQSQPTVRKVFANIPTYLHFDDHDLTDDWNLCRSWYDQVRCSADGTRVIANGLAAYWAFQAWGNQPDDYSEHFIQTLQAHLLDDQQDTDKAAAFDFHLWKLRRWGFMLATQPPIFVLDSRTQRDFGKNNEPPHLMDRYALDWLRGKWLDLCRQSRMDAGQPVTPLFFTGTPVFGFSSIEWVQYAIYQLGILFGNFYPRFSASNLDMESWIANRRGFSFLMDTLMRHMGLRSATFLSGDVHYSFVNRAIYIDYSQPETRNTLQCLQLTSSALRNTPPTWRALETFFANWAVKSKSGYCHPETLPWWERIFFWRFFRLSTWHVLLEGIAGVEHRARQKPSHWRYPLSWRKFKVSNGRVRWRENVTWITSRPNIAVVSLRDGKVVKQTLLSGDQCSNRLTFKIDPPQTR